jgi:3-hydroxyacyl-[acyl-carrier-protein] dehydratase
VGVRYCGGCNPYYDRRAAYEKISDDVTSFAERNKEEIRFETAEEGVLYDAFLVVSGCANRCASIGQYASKAAPIYLWNESGIADVSAQLKTMIGE